MKKKLVSALLCATMVAGCFSLAGCGGSSDGDSNNSSNNASDDANAGESGDETPAGDDAAGGDSAAESSTEVAADFADTYGDANGTHLELWTFVNVHATFYGTMVEKWNEANPDRTIELTATAYPFADMHNKLLMSFQAGDGAR